MSQFDRIEQSQIEKIAKKVVAASGGGGGGSGTVTQVNSGTGLTGGPITTTGTISVSFGTSGTTACVGNDARLSDARTPTAHVHAAGDVTSGTLNIARIPTGTTSTTVSLGNHTHAAEDVTSGTFDIARIPTGTTSTTVSLGNHTHLAAGSTTQVQYNNATAIAGATNVNIDANNLRLLDANLTSASAAGGLTMFSKKFNLFHYPSWMDEQGQWRNTQVCIARSRVMYWYGIHNSTTALTGVGVAAPTAAAGSTLTIRNLATGNYLASSHRIGNVSAATSAGRAGWRSTVPMVVFSNTAGCGGCHIVCRFIVSDATIVSGARMFIGLSATSTEFAAATEVNTLFNLVGFCQGTSLAVPGNIYTITNDGTGTATTSNTGYALSQNDVLEATFQTVPGNASIVGCRLDNLTANTTIFEGTITTDLPVNGSLLYFHMFRTNGSTAQAVALDCLQTYFEFPG